MENEYLSDEEMNKRLASGDAEIYEEELSDEEMNARLASGDAEIYEEPVVKPIQPKLPIANDPSQLEAFGRGAVQGVSAGFGDELGAAVLTPVESARRFLSKYIPGTVENTDEKLRDQGFILDEEKSTYQDLRDTTREANKESEKEFGKTYMAGEIAGGIAPAIATGGAGAASLGKTVTQSALKGIGKGAISGAKFGALEGLGRSEADLTKGEIGKAVQDVKKGAATGMIFGGVLSAGGAALRKSGKVLADRSATIRNFVNTHNLVKGGNEVIGKKAEKRITKDIDNFVEKDLVSSFRDAKTKAEQAVESVYSSAERGGKKSKIDVSDILNDLKTFKKQRGPDTGKEIDSLIGELEVHNFKELSPRQLNDIAKEFGKMSKRMDTAASPKAYNISKELKTLRDKSLGKESAEELAEANILYKSYKNAEKQLPQIREADSIAGKAAGIEGMVERLGQGTSGARRAKRIIDGYINKIGEINPKQADYLRSRSSQLTEEFVVNQMASGGEMSTQRIVDYITRSGGEYTGKAHKLAKDISKVAKTGKDYLTDSPIIKKAANITEKVAEKVVRKPSEYVKSVMSMPKSKLMELKEKAISPKVRNFFNSLSEVESENKKRALLFSAMQYPHMREELSSLLGNDSEE